ncbi:hypothetical protein [Brevibacillus sp. B_LB10_24]|uniref:hypothetical protein n=1 Tax=Brevibacillus sp. B_LB10_24 TaxID=3380645 RepID=UPI0038BB4EF5
MMGLSKGSKPNTIKEALLSIERISTTHLVVGIDMAKETNMVQETNYRGIVLTNRHHSFSNNKEGFKKQQRWI